MSDNKHEWTGFYMELANRLLEYKDDRAGIISKIRQVYAKTGIKLPKLESDNNIEDIDPFTVYGLFNKGISDANRIAITKGIAVEFGVKAAAPDNFDGVPLLNNLNATFYHFKEERGEHDIDNLWRLFEAAVSYADMGTEQKRQDFIAAYNAVLAQAGIRWNITMGLYWVRPYAYINLDSTNRWYIADPEHLPADCVAHIKPMLGSVPQAEQYLEIVRLCKAALDTGEYEYRTFPELSKCAWVAAKKSGQDKKGAQSNAAHIRWARPVITALRELGGSGTPAQVRAKIVEDEGLTQDEISVTRGKTNVNKFDNEVAFARNDLAAAGYIDKSVHGIWTLTQDGMTVEMTDALASDLFKNNVAMNVARHNDDGGAFADGNVDTVRYWIYAPGRGAEKWEECVAKGVMLLGWGEIGDLDTFDSKDEIKQKMKAVYGDGNSYKNSAYATWQFAHDLKPGDIVFVKKGLYEIIGRGVVESGYIYDDSRTDKYNHVRHVKWTHEGNWKISHQTPQKTLTDITPYSDFVQQIKDLFNDETLDEDEETETVYPPYSAEDFINEVYMDEEHYNDIVAVLKSKKNIILQGAPGVGKTFAAKRLAYSIMGVKDVDRVMMVQFHQSYSYEDFIMGFRPTDTGFALKKGAFYTFCKKAEIDGDNDYFFIIDEINRGNLSKIFGELFMLIENDKRGIELQLMYSDEKFAVPKNVYIIGMMNTADRSLAILDYALRRRFAFVEIEPGFNTEGFKAYKANLDNAKFERLITCVNNLNDTIKNDDSLGKGFCIGHSYFCNLTPETATDKKLAEVVKYELVPLLREYWYDEPAEAEKWAENLRRAIE